jgi:hypothetical protein
MLDRKFLTTQRVRLSKPIIRITSIVSILFVLGIQASCGGDDSSSGQIVGSDGTELIWSQGRWNEKRWR